MKIFFLILMTAFSFNTSFASAPTYSAPTHADASLEAGAWVRCSACGTVYKSSNGHNCSAIKRHTHP